MHPRDRHAGLKHGPSTKPAVVVLMGAWEDGFAAGYAKALQFGTSKPEHIEKMGRWSAGKARNKPKRKGKAPRGMSSALKKANKKAKLKSGKFRKGWDRSRMMKYAHKIRK